MDFPLKYPVDFNGTKVETLTFRRPKGSDLQMLAAAKGNEVTTTFKLYAGMSNQPPELFSELDAEDLQTIGAWIEPLLVKNDQLSGTAGG